MEDPVQQTLLRLGIDLQRESKATLKANGSYRTGALYNSIEVNVEPYKSTYIVKAGMLFYGEFLEFGTRKMRPKPFLQPSLTKLLESGGLEKITQAVGQVAVEIVAKKLDKVIISN